LGSIVLEQNPSKQGLKPEEALQKVAKALGFRAKSIKTRIETAFPYASCNSTNPVLEQNPSKQGLKHLHLFDNTRRLI